MLVDLTHLVPERAWYGPVVPAGLLTQPSWRTLKCEMAQLLLDHGRLSCISSVAIGISGRFVASSPDNFSR